MEIIYHKCVTVHTTYLHVNNIHMRVVNDLNVRKIQIIVEQLNEIVCHNLGEIGKVLQHTLCTTHTNYRA